MNRIAIVVNHEHDKGAVANATVILKSTGSKSMNFCENILVGNLLEQTNAITFSKRGKILNNQYGKYVEIVESNTLLNLVPIAIIIACDEPLVKNLTRKFAYINY